jgi:hypothetical protein
MQSHEPQPKTPQQGGMHHPPQQQQGNSSFLDPFGVILCLLANWHNQNWIGLLSTCPLSGERKYYYQLLRPLQMVNSGSQVHPFQHVATRLNDQGASQKKHGTLCAQCNVLS